MVLAFFPRWLPTTHVRRLYNYEAGLSLWVRVTYVPDTDRSFLEDCSGSTHKADPRVASVLTTQGHPVTRHEHFWRFL